MPISEPVCLPGGMWVVQTSYGTKLFSDGETAYDFYLLNKHREEKNSNGNPPNP
jgi:hypothetical protein